MRVFLACCLFLAGCSSDGAPGRDASVGRDAADLPLLDASGLLADAATDAALDAAADAALDAGPRILGREDMNGLVLNGTIPPADVRAPEFTATAHTGDPRTRADLLGRRTVMWFFPQAYTGG